MGNGAGPPRACRKRRRRENASRPHHCRTFLHCNLLRFHAEPFSLVFEKRPRWRRRSDSPKRAIIIFHLVAVAPEPSVSDWKPGERQFLLRRYLGATARTRREPSMLEPKSVPTRGIATVRAAATEAAGIGAQPSDQPAASKDRERTGAPGARQETEPGLLGLA